MSTVKKTRSLDSEGAVPIVPIYRKQVLGDIEVGRGGHSFEAAALHTIAEIVESLQRNEDVDRHRIVHDTIETEYEGHRVKVSLGEHVEYQG